MARQEVTVAADAGNTHGEGPVWSDSEQKLYWTDVETSTLWQLDPSSGRTRKWKMPGEGLLICLPRARGAAHSVRVRAFFL